eukprot:903813_1
MVFRAIIQADRLRSVENVQGAQLGNAERMVQLLRKINRIAQNRQIRLEKVAYRDLMLVGLVPTILILPVRFIRKDFRRHPDLRLARIENDQEAQLGNAERVVQFLRKIEWFY